MDSLFYFFDTTLWHALIALFTYGPIVFAVCFYSARVYYTRILGKRTNPFYDPAPMRWWTAAALLVVIFSWLFPQGAFVSGVLLGLVLEFFIREDYRLGL